MGDTKVLMQRIAMGRIWLLENENNPHYAEGLERYEKLVDEATALGIKEQDCWAPAPEEAEKIFEEKKPEQAKLLTNGL